MVADNLKGLRVIDVSDPLSPAELGAHETPNRARGVTTTDDHVLVASGGAGLRVIDVSDPSSIAEVGFYDTRDRAFGVAATGDLALVANSFVGLLVIDISDPIFTGRSELVRHSWVRPGCGRYGESGPRG